MQTTEFFEYRKCIIENLDQDIKQLEITREFRLEQLLKLKKKELNEIYSIAYQLAGFTTPSSWTKKNFIDRILFMEIGLKLRNLKSRRENLYCKTFCKITDQNLTQNTTLFCDKCKEKIL